MVSIASPNAFPVVVPASMVVVPSLILVHMWTMPLVVIFSITLKTSFKTLLLLLIL
ncbi:hypothetical protein Hanom_Chr11g01042861 [Helianthus anomalus]